MFVFLKELKSLPYFNGIDWEKVVNGLYDPPFAPFAPFEATEFQVNIQTKLDHEALFANDADDQLDADVVDRFRGKLKLPN